MIKEIETLVKIHHVGLNRDFTLQSDASNDGIGGALLQDGKIVGLYSKKLNESERNYTTVEKELYAIIKSMENLKKFI